ncbi:fungal specific transcription factor domain [Cordyceps militaris]|uniref:Fungal specific transcription factor domain n=1 Tax=Cordyceps militaris TaxID=73501 RepID=A0A2H4SEM1_CORMI|nr:fungal specific transcription factor domain [Cordyceps militaris]
MPSTVSIPPNDTTPDQAPANMQDRINKLENLVLDLMHQASPSSRTSPMPVAQHSPSEQGCPSATHLLRLDTESETVAVSESRRDVSPSPSDYGSFRHREKVVSYVSSSHWAAVLDSITDLRNHLAQEEDTTLQDAELARPQTEILKPQLFYSGGHLDGTITSIIRCLPPRPTIDRLLSRYFNDLDIAPGVVHSGQFLAEYEEFWQAPESAPIAWIGLLFSIICLSTHLQQASQTQPPVLLVPSESGHQRKISQLAENKRLIDLYKSQSIKCLLLCQWTKGGPYVLETLILYFLVECFHLKDMEIGIWVLVGNIVQIAIHMGYHRDTKHFPSISPFAGEMRRRVWAMILQLDSSVSAQLGLPRLIREQHADTEKPRNLNDMDFDINTTKLPESRPETDVTPTLYVLAKLRLLDVGAKVADMATEPRPHSYSDILKLDKEISEARDALPSILKWTGLALNVSSQITIQRIWLEVICQQLRIVLNKKFLDPSRPQQQFGHSRSACLSAAMKILELQRLVDEETQTDGLLYQSRWRVSSAFNNEFLLATSVLCFYMKTCNKLQKGGMDVAAETGDSGNIKGALQQAQQIWIRQCAGSKEARKAVTALHHVLGPTDANIDLPSDYETQSISTPSFLSATAISNFPEFNFSNATSGSVDGFNWQGFPAEVVQNHEDWAGAGDMEQMDFSSW